MAKGKYIVIEGNDGTGKSTQAELLAKYLQTKGIATFITHEPGGAPIADAIRTVIKDAQLARDGETNVLLFTAARHEIWKKANAELEKGAWVISARNYISTLVYQGYGEHVPLDRIRDITATFTDETYMTPDHTFILHLTETERETRLQTRDSLSSGDTFESREQSFQYTVNTGYETIAKELNLPLIDANRPIEDIQAELQKLIFG